MVIDDVVVDELLDVELRDDYDVLNYVVHHVLHYDGSSL
jgi:hypothetical protein